MSIKLEVLESEALKLTPADRSHLLARLSASLGAATAVAAARRRPIDSNAAEPNSGSVDDVHGRMAIGRLLARLPR